MQNRYRMYRRGTVYYAKDKTTGRAVTLGTEEVKGNVGMPASSLPVSTNDGLYNAGG